MAINVFGCPSDARPGEPQYTHGDRLVGLTSYVGVAGTDYMSKDGIFFLDSQVRPTDIRDGLSNTFLIGERRTSFETEPSPDHGYGWWYAGAGQSLSGSPDMVLGMSEVNLGARHEKVVLKSLMPSQMAI